jgi:hypothetical protein
VRRATLLAAAALAALVSPVLAKAPKPADVPSVEDLYQSAQKAIDQAAKEAFEKSRDPLREAIDNYRDKKTPYTDFQKLVDCLNNAKDDNVQPYRADAAQALLTRFSKEDESDPQVRATRRQIVLAILDLMKADKKDEIGLRAIESILFTWWKQRMQSEVKFRATDKLDDRKKAHTKMKKYLQGEN